MSETATTYIHTLSVCIYTCLDATAATAKYLTPVPQRHFRASTRWCASISRRYVPRGNNAERRQFREATIPRDHAMPRDGNHTMTIPQCDRATASTSYDNLAQRHFRASTAHDNSARRRLRQFRAPSEQFRATTTPRINVRSANWQQRLPAHSSDGERCGLGGAGQPPQAALVQDVRTDRSSVSYC